MIKYKVSLQKVTSTVSSQAPQQITEPEALRIMQNLLATISGVDPEKVVKEADFIHDLNVDSLGMMEMLLEAEEKFDTEFDIADAQPDEHGLFCVCLGCLSSSGAAIDPALRGWNAAVDQFLAGCLA